MAARYMLDTDTCSYIMKRSSQAVVKRLRAVPVPDVCISVITKSELLHGVEVSPRRLQDATALQAFLPHVEVLEFPVDAATHYAQIRADLKKRGQMIGANDLFIAAHARSLGLRLVTNNTAEFGRVKGLTLENWTHPAPHRAGVRGGGPAPVRPPRSRDDE
jgi:tRNA(fMet)-specific endonuclease VapC